MIAIILNVELIEKSISSFFIMKLNGMQDINKHTHIKKNTEYHLFLLLIIPPVVNIIS
jgi:hypothetical protein